MIEEYPYDPRTGCDTRGTSSSRNASRGFNSRGSARGEPFSAVEFERSFSSSRGGGGYVAGARRTADVTHNFTRNFEWPRQVASAHRTIRRAERGISTDGTHASGPNVQTQQARAHIRNQIFRTNTGHVWGIPGPWLLYPPAQGVGVLCVRVMGLGHGKPILLAAAPEESTQHALGSRIHPPTATPTPYPHPAHVCQSLPSCINPKN